MSSSGSQAGAERRSEVAAEIGIRYLPDQIGDQPDAGGREHGVLEVVLEGLVAVRAEADPASPGSVIVHPPGWWMPSARESEATGAAVISVASSLARAGGVTWPDRPTLSRSALAAPLHGLVLALRDGTSRDSRAGSPTADEFAAHALRALTLGIASDAHRAAQAPTPETRSYDAALAAIAVSASDPDFDSDRLAARLHVSRRTLEREFWRRGTTVSRSIRSRRVASAVLLLSDPSLRHLRVSDIARRSGFASDDDLRRALRAQLGSTPRALRLRSGRGASETGG